MIHPRQFFSSVRHALRGVGVVFRSEQSFRLQVAGAVVALVAGFAARLSRNEFIVVLLLIGAVLTLEIINSIFERLVDSFQPRIHPVVRDVKDIMAGAVLIVSFVALVVGAVIFWPSVKAFVLY